MYKTLQTLQTLIDPATTAMTLEEVAESYRVSLNPSLLALAFEKLFPLLLSTASKFAGLTLEDVASFSLQEIDYALQSYKPGKYAFTTYSLKVVSNRLREETIANNQQKRKANQCCEDIDAIRSESIVDMDKQLAQLEFYDALNSCNLTERERTYCAYIIGGYPTREIAADMHITPQRLCQYRKQLRKKLSPVYELAQSSI